VDTVVCTPLDIQSSCFRDREIDCNIHIGRIDVLKGIQDDKGTRGIFFTRTRRIHRGNKV
jgi:hypothetical protein